MMMNTVMLREMRKVLDEAGIRNEMRGHVLITGILEGWNKGMLDREQTLAELRDLVAGRPKFAKAYPAFDPAKHVVRWIPVAERLPTSGKRVLAYDRNSMEVARYYAVTGWVVSGEVFYASHWQPLPEPPEKV